MKKIIATLCVILLISCGKTVKVHDSSELYNKSGIIGVFQQPIGFCSGGYQQWINVNGINITVKPTWTSDQDNLFSEFLDEGDAEILSYTYGCGNRITTISLENPKIIDDYPTLIIPENGFCKIVISLLPKQKFFLQNDSLLIEHFNKNKIKVDYDKIPYCTIKK